MPYPKQCPDCRHDCSSHAECLRYQDFNIIVDDARAIAKLKKTIKSSTPEYKGKNKQWFSQVPMFMEDKAKHLSHDAYTKLPAEQYGYRFTTITFDPKKFSLEELVSPQKLINFIGNVLEELKPFYTKMYLTYELTRLGIVHAHINYTCDSVLAHATFQLRLKYYFAKDLRNRHAIHDRIFNSNGIDYMTNKNYTGKQDTKLFKHLFILHSNGSQEVQVNQNNKETNASKTN